MGESWMEKAPMDEQLRELVRGLERKMGLLNEGEMACCHITMAQCHTLVEIGRGASGRPGLTLNALAARLNLDSSTTSRTVQNLVVSGLVRREPDPEDRRAVVIALTPEGEDQYAQMEEGMKRRYQSVLERIPEERHAQVLESLALVLEAMSACCGTPECTGEDGLDT
jgi:DNA-binding MarR family transcriptional regulator